MNPFSFLFHKIEKLYDKKISSAGLVVFRITWSIMLFFEVREMYLYRELRFNPIPFINESPLDFGPILILWMLLILSITIGYQTKKLTVINYLLSMFFFGNINTFEYHIFYTYIGVNFLLMFTPLSASYSIDNLLTKIKYSRAGYSHILNTKVSVLFYYAPILVGVAFFYLDSVFFKLDSKAWLNGMALWMPAVIPNFNVSDFSLILNNKFIVVSLCYITLVFEFVFLFIFFMKKFRWINFIIGFSLHFGILLIFPIPIFALAMCSIYFLIIPVSTWQRLRNKLSAKTPKITFIYDSECPLCNKTKVFIESIDFFNRISFDYAQNAKEKYKELTSINQSDLITNIYSVSKKGKVFKGVDTYIQVLHHTILLSPIAVLISLPGIKQISNYVYSYISKNRERETCNNDNCVIYLPPDINNENKSVIKGISLKKIKIFSFTSILIIFTVLQLNVSLDSGIIGKLVSKSNLWNSTIGHSIKPIHQKIIKKSQVFLGVTSHALFIDKHLMSFNNVFAITYIDKDNNEIWLPIVDKTCKPGRLNLGANWAKWNFRVNRPTYDEQLFTDGVIKYCAFWAGRNNISLKNTKFKLKLKKIKTPLVYEKDFLMNNRTEDNWITFGELNWVNNTPIIDLLYKPIKEGSNDFKKITK